MSSIIFLDPNEVSSKKKGRRTKTTKYGKYIDQLAPLIESIRERIELSNDGRAIIKSEELARNMGMSGKHDTTIYWGVKYAMWQHGIAVDSGTHADGKSKLLIFREPAEGEKLPDSLARYVESDEPAEGEDPEEPGEEEDPEEEDPEEPGEEGDSEEPGEEEDPEEPSDLD